MTVLERLKDYRWLKIEYDQLIEEFERLKSHVERTTQSLNPQYSTGGSIDPDKIGNYVSKMDVLMKRIQKKLCSIYDEMEECEKLLDVLPQPHRTVMQLYYINSYTFLEIALRIGYTEEHCRKLACQARNQLAV